MTNKTSNEPHILIDDLYKKHDSLENYVRSLADTMGQMQVSQSATDQKLDNLIGMISDLKTETGAENEVKRKSLIQWIVVVITIAGLSGTLVSNSMDSAERLNISRNETLQAKIDANTAMDRERKLDSSRERDYILSRLDGHMDGGHPDSVRNLFETMEARVKINEQDIRNQKEGKQ